MGFGISSKFNLMLHTIDKLAIYMILFYKVNKYINSNYVLKN